MITRLDFCAICSFVRIFELLQVKLSVQFVFGLVFGIFCVFGVDIRVLIYYIMNCDTYLFAKDNLVER